MLHTTHKRDGLVEVPHWLTLVCLALFQILNWSKCIPYIQTIRIIIGYCRFVVVYHVYNIVLLLYIVYNNWVLICIIMFPLQVSVL